MRLRARVARMTQTLSGADILGYFIAVVSIITWFLFTVSGQGTLLLTVAGLVQVAAWIGGASGVECGALTAPVALLFLHAVLRRPPPFTAADDALTVLCDPCHGRPGKCTCASKADCGWELCGAPDTRPIDITAEIDAWFGEGGQR